MTVLNPIRKRLEILIVALTILHGCGPTKAIHREEMHGLGRFEYREPVEGLEAVVIGAPHGRTDANSDRLALAISDRTGAGLVIAYGFKSKRLSVTQPVVRSRPYLVLSRSPLQRGNVFTEYKRILRETAKGDLDLYIGVHRSSDKKVADRIEVATSGLTFEETGALKEVYTEIRDQLTQGREVPRLTMFIEPLDRISWRTSGVKHHGVLLVAEKGLNLRIPHILSSESAEGLYTEVLSRWVDAAITLLRENPLRLPQVQVKLMDLGRLELIESRRRLPGVVIASPHGSFDEYTAEMVKRISYRTGFAAVIAKGFTPTEASGWRINVNRPTEKTFPSEGMELHSKRATQVYRAFRDLVLEAAVGDLKLYIDIHQYNTDSKIQVATVGVSREQGRIIKMLYHEIRDQILGKKSDIPAVELLIEPLDEIEIGAWAAKAEGILGLAEKSLHFELPSHKVFATGAGRDAYTRVLADLLKEIVPLLTTASVK
ncbi:MAG: hypothetical protein HY694_05465 [Deltaproteobacteria bacterium]|nr:hypothetical protein [Deltaproteobacteria bacterium]